MSNPFVMTKEEMASLDPNHKRPKKKIRVKSKENEESSNRGKSLKITYYNQGRLSEISTSSSRLKKRVSENLLDIWEELVSSEDDGDGEEERDPTYELACMKKDIRGTLSLSDYVTNSRSMFLLNYLVSVKFKEAKRLEVELRNEEMILQRNESQLRLAEQAFDQFLQENDHDALEATKLAEKESSIRKIKMNELKITNMNELCLNRDIESFREVLKKYEMYEKFLYSLSPQEWKDSLKVEEEKEGQDLKVMLYFKSPSQLLDIFTSLEDENLWLIQKYREAEGDLDKLQIKLKETEREMSQSILDFKEEIANLEAKIKSEYEEIEVLEKTVIKSEEEEKSGASVSKLSPEHQTLQEFYIFVHQFHKACVSLTNGDDVDTNKELFENFNREKNFPQNPNSWDEILPMLKDVELIMESLTEHLEELPSDKIKLNQRICEKERRLREHKARIDKQKKIEADRNKRALNRALAPPFRPNILPTRSERQNFFAIKKSKKRLKKNK